MFVMSSPLSISSGYPGTPHTSGTDQAVGTGSSARLGRAARNSGGGAAAVGVPQHGTDTVLQRRLLRSDQHQLSAGTDDRPHEGGVRAYLLRVADAGLAQDMVVDGD